MLIVFEESLRDLFPEGTYDIKASTPLDALKLLATNHPLVDKIRPRAVRIRQIKDLSLLTDPSLQSKTFEIIPADHNELNKAFYSGAGGDNGWVNVIIGVVIIVVAVVAAPVSGGSSLAAGGAAVGGGAAATTGFSYAAFAAQMAMSIGVSLVLTGLMQLLAPKPKDAEGNKSSRKFGTQTTTELGAPIQMIFGLHRAYFHLISFNVDARKYDGVDRPDDSPYFKEKVDEHLPEANLNRFYGIYQAGDETKLLQVNNEVNRTGMEY